ncbi:MAG: hypothetical protein JWN44_3038 [Myxococcales bacterium]|nr:hypothetical protein [Myxococcales bacterium]
MTLFVALLGVATGGCYSPKVSSGGFTCQITDDPPCPAGFYCVGGFCLDHPGTAIGPDLAMVSTDDMTLPMTGDLSMSRDLAGAPADMVVVSGDMACFAFGHTCADNACCMQCCAGGCTVFGYCALQ